MNSFYYTVVIPAYNSEMYIRECLDSVVCQNNGNIQIIVVNDGSRDSTLEILEDYKNKNLINMVVTQDNRGQSSARNHGMIYAEGEYVLFLDSDDMLVEGFFERIDGIISSEDLDIVFFDADEFYDGIPKDENKVSSYNRPGVLYDKVVAGVDFFSTSVRYGKYNVSPCMFVCRRGLLNKIRFFEGISAEDNLFTTALLFEHEVNRVKAIKDKLYRRRYRANSEVSRVYSLHYLTSYLTVFNELKKLEYKNKELSQFRGNLLALALKTLAGMRELSFSEYLKYRLAIFVHVVKEPMVLNSRLFISLLFPGLYGRAVPYLKRILTDSGV